jgi:DNA polymerase III alpha subunit
VGQFLDDTNTHKRIHSSIGYLALAESEAQWRSEQTTTGRTAKQHLTRVHVGGMVVASQQPPTAKGITFLALEDATGIVNVVLKPTVVAKRRKALGAPFVIVEGQVQRHDRALSVLGSRVLPVYARV